VKTPAWMTALIVAAAVSTGAVQAPPAGRILVMPFENLNRDGRIFWLGEASAVLLTDDLSALGANPITRSERLQALERLQVPPAAALSDATVIRIGQLVGATQIILGSLQMDDDMLVVRARSIAVDAGRVQTDATVKGLLQDLFPTFEKIARQIAPSAKTADEIERLHPPVAAFENFIKGLLAETPATAINYLNAALQLQPDFDRARLAMWDIYAEQNDHERALSAVSPVGSDAPWGRRARFLAGLSQVQLKKYDEAFATFKALSDAPPPPTVLNNLGIVQLRRGALRDSGLPTLYFKQAVEIDPDDSDYLFNLGYAYWQQRDPQAAIYWLRETVRRTPADGDAHFVLGAALAAAGNPVEAAREKELAKRLSSRYDGWEKRAGAEAVPKGLERIKSEVELPHAFRIDTKLTSSEQRNQKELAQFYLDRARRQYQTENDRDAAIELKHALYLSPYLADAHVLLGRIHLRNGRLHEAIDAFKIAVWSAETAGAHAALGEAYRQADDPGAARTEAQRALTLDPASAEAKELLDRLNAR
jgi:tetratricopeptide (TPR) repeat protein